MPGDPRPALTVNERLAGSTRESTDRPDLAKAEIDAWTRIHAEGIAKRRAEKEAFRVIGMGFWRLVWIVALGILVAQATAALFIAVFRALAG